MTKSIKTPIIPQVLESLLLEFPDRLSSKILGKELRSNGYNFETSGGQLANYLKRFGYMNDYHGSKMWTKIKTTPPEPPKLIGLQSFSIQEIIAELKDRGYTGKLIAPGNPIIL
jgi:hypothetical protein